jgi:hypothetical protein
MYLLSYTAIVKSYKRSLAVNNMLNLIVAVAVFLTDGLYATRNTFLSGAF